MICFRRGYYFLYSLSRLWWDAIWFFFDVCSFCIVIGIVLRRSFSLELFLVINAKCFRVYTFFLCVWRQLRLKTLLRVSVHFTYRQLYLELPVACIKNVNLRKFSLLSLYVIFRFKDYRLRRVSCTLTQYLRFPFSILFCLSNVYCPCCRKCTSLCNFVNDFGSLYTVRHCKSNLRSCGLSLS